MHCDLKTTLLISNKQQESMEKKMHIIFTTDYKEEDYREGFAEFCEDNDLDIETQSFDDFIQETISNWMDDEYCNLNRECGTIIAIADLGLWNGRRSAYRIFDKGNINAIFDALCGEYCTLYVEGNDVKAKCVHHDGTNYITFREVREDRNIERICDMLYNQEEVSSKLISAYTKPLGKRIREIYGW